MTQGAPFQHVTPQAADQPKQGAPFQHGVNATPSTLQGAPFQHITPGTTSPKQGAPLQHEALAIKGTSQGAPFQHDTNALPVVPPLLPFDALEAAPGPVIPAAAAAPLSPPLSPLFADDLTPPQRRELARRLDQLPGDSGFVGRFTGPAYPFGATAGSVLGPKDDISVVVTSIVNIVTTPKGSVPYDPFMGSEVPLLIFELLNGNTLALIRYFTRKDIEEQDERVAVRAVTAEIDPQDEHRIFVKVGFSIVGDPEGRVFGVPVVFNRENIGGI